MNTILLGGIQYVVNAVVGWLIWLMGVIADGISHLALIQASLPWVHNAKTDVETVAWTILGFYVGYVALTRYILWNEGTADPDGSALFKGILRTAIYVAVSGFVATAMFNWGINFAGWITGGTMLQAAQAFHGLWGNIVALGPALIGAALGLTLGILVGVLLLIVVCFQMGIRAAQLVVYIVASPLAALGQMQADGGTWNGWWANLVILSLSQAVQMLCFVGLTETTQLLTTPADTHWIYAMAHHMPVEAPAAMGLNVLVTVLNVVFALFLMIGWLVVAIQGPHLLKQWSYRTGIAGGLMFVGTSMGRSVGDKTATKLVQHVRNIRGG